MAADPTATFFEELAKRDHEPILESTTGTLLIELQNGKRTEYWHVAIDQGDITLSRAKAEADAVIRADKALFDGLVTGRVNAMTAALRGVLQVEGNLGLMMSLQRLFPGPPKSVYAKKIR